MLLDIQNMTGKTNPNTEVTTIIINGTMTGITTIPPRAGITITTGANPPATTNTIKTTVHRSRVFTKNKKPAV